MGKGSIRVSKFCFLLLAVGWGLCPQLEPLPKDDEARFLQLAKEMQLGSVKGEIPIKLRTSQLLQLALKAPMTRRKS